MQEVALYLILAVVCMLALLGLFIIIARGGGVYDG